MMKNYYPTALKPLLTMVLSLTISTYFNKAQAQDDGPKRAIAAVSIGPELNFPQRSAYNFGFGGSFKAELPVASAWAISVTAGYHNFSYKSFNIGSAVKQPDDQFVPLKAGVRYFLDPRIYTEGELGTVIDHNKDRSTNLFAYSLGTGFLFPITDNKRQLIDVGLRYESWSQNRLQQFGIRVAYKFGF
ncbi:hypothetical protein LLH06_04415 [Mucilaginibacter daejeonensis]|uniref:hypothetical protein n=1 Tax=Mucilaginibacter daejeonensis TaxID=398049 RepID=UPI001D1713BC|nr:hypothetical protein [Mucilaginibacter daejeonensis]UEG54212.1 hypothetical protein LLH06_04415 [Mucilaginibacter daejeonensis]